MKLALFVLSTVLAASCMPAAVRAGDPAPSPLHHTILMQDQALFGAFNACDLEAWRAYLADDVEFYQDNDDPTTTRQALEPSFLSRCSGGGRAALVRELVRESVQVHPMQAYGAVQFGAHRFWLRRDGQPDELLAEPRFVHLWRLRDGAWQITRVISYDH